MLTTPSRLVSIASAISGTVSRRDRDHHLAVVRASVPGQAGDSCWHSLLDLGKRVGEAADNRTVADMTVAFHSRVQGHTAVADYPDTVPVLVQEPDAGP